MTARHRREPARLSRAVASPPGSWPARCAAGCSSGGFNGIYSIPLPGGASLGSHPYQVTAAVHRCRRPGPAVSGHGERRGRRAGDQDLPAAAQLDRERHDAGERERAPAGERHRRDRPVQPARASSTSRCPRRRASRRAGRLANGAVIPVSRTTADATVEEVLGALSLLLNGGGISQLHTITTQLDAALDRQRAADPLAARAVAHAARQPECAPAATSRRRWTGSNTLSATLATRDRQIGHVLDNLTPGLKVLADQRAQLVAMLDSLHRLTGVAVSTINASQTNLVSDLRELEPSLRELANAGQNLPLACRCCSPTRLPTRFCRTSRATTSTPTFRFRRPAGQRSSRRSGLSTGPGGTDAHPVDQTEAAGVRARRRAGTRLRRVPLREAGPLLRLPADTTWSGSSSPTAAGSIPMPM